MTNQLRLEPLEAILEQALTSLELEGTVTAKAVGVSLFATLDVSNQASGTALDEIKAMVDAFAKPKLLVLTFDEQRIGQGIRLSLTLTPEKSLHVSNELDTIDTVVNDLIRAFETELKLRQKRRSRDELPDPKKSPQAYVNRNKSSRKQVKFEMEPKEAQHLDLFNKASGMTKRQILKEALELYYVHKGWKPPEDEPEIAPI